eukprot:352195-Chlamydomonas_euryale.AAC.8
MIMRTPPRRATNMLHFLRVATSIDSPRPDRGATKSAHDGPPQTQGSRGAAAGVPLTAAEA